MGPLGIDLYAFSARQRPVLIASLPVILVVLALSEPAYVAWSGLGSLLLTTGLVYALGEKAADTGRKAQDALWNDWGGSPTLQLLRHRTTTLNPHTFQKVHAALLAVAGVRGPSRQEEDADPAAAELIYLRCEERLRVIARDNPDDYPAVFRANCEYGYRRNLWAIRRWAWLALGAALVVAIVNVVVNGATQLAALALIGSALYAGYLTTVTETWVRHAAELYALRLVESCEAMSSVMIDGPPPQVTTSSRALP